MIQCSRAPKPCSGSKWKTMRCSQYSKSVHSAYQPITSPILGGRRTINNLQAPSSPIPGTKMITGTSGCTREQASSSRDSNIGGESLSTSVLLVAPCSPVSCAQAI